MWDEKQFFEDFVKESDKIKPDQDFVERMVALTDENNVNKIASINNGRNNRNRKILATAAVALILVSVAGIGLLGKDEQSKVLLGDSQVQVGNAVEDKTKGDSVENQFGGIVVSPKNEVEALMEQLRDETITVTNEEGNDIRQNERELLVSMLAKAKEIDTQPEEISKTVTYIIAGETETKLQVVDDKFLIINEGKNLYSIE